MNNRKISPRKRQKREIRKKMILQTTPIDFDKLADETVSTFYNDGTPLSDAITKVAMRECLNPEEIKRLVERSNTGAVLRLLKVATDKKAEIDLADPEEVLKNTHAPTQPKDVVKEASDFSIPDLRPSKLDINLKSFIKIAEKEEPGKPIGAVEFFKLEKRAHELLNRKTSLELSIQRDLDYLVSEFSKQNPPDFQKFASEALTLHEGSQYILTKLASLIEESAEFEKTAEIIDDTQPLLIKMGSLLDQIDKLLEVNRDYQETKESKNNFFKRYMDNANN